MQAIDQRATPASNDTFTRVMAAFGMIVAALLIAAAVIYGVILAVSAFGPPTTSLTGDPLAATAVVQFRNSEHAGAQTVSNGDPLAAPAMVQFRNSEHSDAAAKPWTGDPLSAPSLVEFRNSEHAGAR